MMVADPPIRLVLVLVLLCFVISGVAAETYCYDGIQVDRLFTRPTDLAVDDAGAVYVAEQWCCVMRYDAAGAGSIIPWVPPETRPRGVAADGVRVYSAEPGNRRVEVFGLDGTRLASWEMDPATNRSPLFLNPVGMGLDSDGRAYVADSGAGSVLGFFPNGTPFLRLESGLGPVDLSSPMDVAVNSTGWAFVADTGHNAIRFYRPNGTGFDAGGWGGFGNNSGQFRAPVGIAIDGADNVYVADRDNHRVQKFTADGTFVATWGTPGSSAGDLRSPEGVAVDGNGTVIVADTGNGRVKRFRLLLPVPGTDGRLPTMTGGVLRRDDVNGNGRRDFSDVVLYFNQMAWIEANEPVSAFDNNGNGRIDFADVVWLFNDL